MRSYPGHFLVAQRLITWSTGFGVKKVLNGVSCNGSCIVSVMCWLKFGLCIGCGVNCSVSNCPNKLAFS